MVTKMIKLENALIQADMQDILNVLKTDLFNKGIERFQIFRPNNRNIQTNCPFHKDGQERKPSFGINIDDGRCHCFTCGWSGDITTMISELNGRYDQGKFGSSWLIQRFSSVELEKRPNILEGFGGRKNVSRNFVADQGNKRIIERDTRFITEKELDKYRYIHPYMYKRGLTDEIIEQFDIGYDKDTQCITFPIRDVDGNCVFVARRNVNTKFFNYPSGVDKPVYLANLFTSGKYKKAYICESFLNALTCWKYGKPAMALIGTGTKEQYEILKKLPVREYVLAFDPDDAGYKATQRFKQNVKGKILKEIIYQQYGKDAPDINDLQEKFLELKELF